MAGITSNLRGALLALLAFAIFAVHDVVVKFLGGLYSPVQIIFFGVLLGFPVITLMMIADRSGRNLRPRHPWWTLIRTLSGVITGLSGFYAFSVLPLAQTYAILFSTPLMITLLAVPVLGEKVGLSRGLAVVAGLIGVLIVLRPGQGALQAGHLAALTSAVFAALASVIVRRIGRDEHSVALLLYPMLANILVLGLALPFVYRPMPVAHLGLMAVIGTIGIAGTLLVIFAYRLAEAAVVAPMQYSQMLWAVIFGALFFGERPDLYTGLGAAVIIASGLWLLRAEGGRKGAAHRPVTGAMAGIGLVPAPRTPRGGPE